VMDVGMESTERYEGYKIGPCSGKDIEWNEWNGYSYAAAAMRGLPKRPMREALCMTCKTHPSGLVSLSAGLIILGIWQSWMSPFLHQSWTAKCWMLMWWDPLVSFLEFTIWMMDWLSSYNVFKLYFTKFKMTLLQH
jgi:hypothetical protein